MSAEILCAGGGVRSNAHVSIFCSISANNVKIESNQQVGGRCALEALPIHPSTKAANVLESIWHLSTEKNIECTRSEMSCHAKSLNWKLEIQTAQSIQHIIELKMFYWTT